MKTLWALVPFAGLILAPPAHADIWTDIQFVREVGDLQISNMGSRDAVINLGHVICQSLDNGMEYDRIVASMDTLTTEAANKVASLAVEHICPNHWPSVVVAQMAFPVGDRVLI